MTTGNPTLGSGAADSGHAAVALGWFKVGL